MTLLLVRREVLKPLRPLPQISYEKMKTLLKGHKTLHFFLHHTYCRLVLAYEPMSYASFHEVTARE